MEANSRQYLETHPWLTFSFDNRRLPSLVWAQLGECFSKSMHLIGTPLMPGVADSLSVIYLRRGALASAQIEGNTLTEKEVQELLDGGKALPPSRQYLEQEVRNVISALESVRETAATTKDDFSLSPDWIKEIHATLMSDMKLEDHVVPGEFRTVGVGVGLYRGAPAEDVDFLMTKLCDWVNAMLADSRAQKEPENRFYFVFLAAVLSHLYIAWIHPFGDGNGRTSRLIECAILATSGLVPWVSANVLSDFYNRTKSQYYVRLSEASRHDDVIGFVAYSAQGFRDELRDQIAAVQDQQRMVAWTNYVHERFQSEPQNKIAKRRRDLVLNMIEDVTYTREQLEILTAFHAREYARQHQRTLARDLTKLKELNLIDEVSKGEFEAKSWLMNAFMPVPQLGTHMPVRVDAGSIRPEDN